jgi:hypothetical protein
MIDAVRSWYTPRAGARSARSLLAPVQDRINVATSYPADWAGQSGVRVPALMESAPVRAAPAPRRGAPVGALGGDAESCETGKRVHTCARPFTVTWGQSISATRMKSADWDGRLSAGEAGAVSLRRPARHLYASGACGRAAEPRRRRSPNATERAHTPSPTEPSAFPKRHPAGVTPSLPESSWSSEHPLVQKIAGATGQSPARVSLILRALDRHRHRFRLGERGEFLSYEGQDTLAAIEDVARDSGQPADIVLTIILVYSTEIATDIVNEEIPRRSAWLIELLSTRLALPAMVVQAVLQDDLETLRRDGRNPDALHRMIVSELRRIWGDDRQSQ